MQYLLAVEEQIVNIDTVTSSWRVNHFYSCTQIIAVTSGSCGLFIVRSFRWLVMSTSRVVLPRIKSFKQVSFVASVVTNTAESVKTKKNGEWLYLFSC